MSIDPRGIFRTVKKVEATPSVVLVSFEECDHVGKMNQSRPNAHRVGDETRCYQCGVEARKAAGEYVA
jgi:hypothetical protein